MVNIDAFRKLALSLPHAEELPHFEKASFRVNKKIFATLSSSTEIATLKLNVIDQSVYCSIDITIIYPVNNKWGKQGWTIIELKKIPKKLLKELLGKAYESVASKK